MKSAVRRTWLLGLWAFLATLGAYAEPPKTPPIDLFPSAKPAPPPPRNALDAPSTVIYPAQRLPIKFSHARHLVRGATCLGCHAQARTSVSVRDNLLPAESACLPCHAIERAQPSPPSKSAAGPSTACNTCHVGDTAERADIPPPPLKFNHRLHADAQIDCVRCHGDLQQVDLATRAQLPRMALCLECHREGLSKVRFEQPGQSRRGPSARCTACHLQQGDGTLQVRFPSGLLVPSGNLRGDDHGSNFTRGHGPIAQSDPSYCANCHSQTYCQRCHNEVIKPLDIHGGDYVHRHGQEARRNQLDCQSCHRQQSFCLGCHERLGVVSQSSLSGAPPPSRFVPGSPQRFHLEGWASALVGQNKHAQEAQRNIRSCTSCHREESCLECHSGLANSRVPGGANPHPFDWVSSGRCQALGSRNSRVCLKCHRAGSAALACSP